LILAQHCGNMQWCEPVIISGVNRGTVADKRFNVGRMRLRASIVVATGDV
jgi:hypothetical protein